MICIIRRNKKETKNLQTPELVTKVNEGQVFYKQVTSVELSFSSTVLDIQPTSSMVDIKKLKRSWLIW